MNIISKYIRSLALFSTLISLTACGGGSGGGGPSNPPPPVGSGWQQGVFLDSDSFYAQCRAPRAGINPATGSAYSDVAGTLLGENNFLRAFSNEIYLWYNEIVDRDPGLYNDTLTYFGLLKTTATTPSGADKDKFHFTYDTDEYFQLSQGGVSAGYGATNWTDIDNRTGARVIDRIGDDRDIEGRDLRSTGIIHCDCDAIGDINTTLIFDSANINHNTSHWSRTAARMGCRGIPRSRNRSPRATVDTVLRGCSIGQVGCD